MKLLAILAACAVIALGVLSVVVSCYAMAGLAITTIRVLTVFQ